MCQKKTGTKVHVPKQGKEMRIKRVLWTKSRKTTNTGSTKNRVCVAEIANKSIKNRGKNKKVQM